MRRDRPLTRRSTRWRREVWRLPTVTPPTVEPRQPPVFTQPVVAAAIVRDGRVLAARRRRPAALAGGWEFPGGKVEPGEAAADALVRECREELGVTVVVGRLLGTGGDSRVTLALYAATTSDEPLVGADHDALCWVGPAELAGLNWLPIDRDLLPTLSCPPVDRP